MSVVSTVGVLLIFIVGSWNMVLTEAPETTGIILKLRELTGGLKFRSPTISSYSSTSGSELSCIIRNERKTFLMIVSDSLY